MKNWMYKLADSTELAVTPLGVLRWYFFIYLSKNVVVGGQNGWMAETIVGTHFTRDGQYPPNPRGLKEGEQKFCHYKHE